MGSSSKYVPFKLAIRATKNTVTTGGYYRTYDTTALYTETVDGKSLDLIVTGNYQNATKDLNGLVSFVEWLRDSGAPSSVFDSFMETFEFYLSSGRTARNFWDGSGTIEIIKNKNPEIADKLTGLAVYQYYMSRSLFHTSPANTHKIALNSWNKLQKLNENSDHDEWMELLNPTANKEFANQGLMEKFIQETSYFPPQIRSTGVADYQRSIFIKWALLLSVIVKDDTEKISDYFGDKGAKIFIEEYNKHIIQNKKTRICDYIVQRVLIDFPIKKYLTGVIPELTVAETRALVEQKYGKIDRSATVKYLEEYIQRIRHGEETITYPDVPLNDLAAKASECVLRGLDKKTSHEISNALSGVARIIWDYNCPTPVGKVILNDWLQHKLDTNSNTKVARIAEAFEATNEKTKTWCTTSGANEKVLNSLYKKTNGDSVFIMELLFEALNKPRSFNQWGTIIDGLNTDIIGLPPVMIMETFV